MAKRKTVIQRHHLSYDPEVTVILYKGEHMILTWLNRRKRISQGIIVALDTWLAQHRYNAVKLTKGG